MRNRIDIAVKELNSFCEVFFVSDERIGAISTLFKDSFFNFVFRFGCIYDSQLLS